MAQPLRTAAAAKSGAAVELVDQFRRGEEAWRASCPRPAEQGSCVELREHWPRPRLFAIERDSALAAEAQERFRTVAKLWRRLGGSERPRATEGVPPLRASRHTAYAPLFRADPDPDAAAAWPARTDLTEAARAAAGAAFYLAEAQSEAFIHILPPRDPLLSRYPPDADLIEKPPQPVSRRMLRRVAAFLGRKLDQLARARQMYLAVVAMREAPFDVAATARLGQLYEAFYDDLPQQELADKAVAAFEKCFDRGAKSGRYDEWFRLCEHGLTVLRPFEFPEAHELVPEASYATSGMVPILVIPRLE